MNRLEQVGETVRAVLNEIATVAPDWLRQVALPEWYKRYSHRIEIDRLPKSESGRLEYAELVGRDGYLIMELVKRKDAPQGVADLPTLKVLSSVWDRHYERKDGTVRFKKNR